jgi:hypothetical protein
MKACPEDNALFYVVYDSVMAIGRIQEECHGRKY